MENIILSMWIFAGSLQIAFLVALIAIAQDSSTLNWNLEPLLDRYLFLFAIFGEYASPFLMGRLTEELTAFTVPNASFTLGQLLALLSSAHLIFLLLGAFGLPRPSLGGPISFSAECRRHTVVTLVSAFRVRWPSTDSE